MKTPAVALINPEFSRNVAEALRACALLGAQTLWVTGTRSGMWDGSRRPRELRLERYSRRVKIVDLTEAELFRAAERSRITPVAVELLPGTEDLRTYDHPRRALYVFGPEDGTLSKDTRSQCHEFVQIPMDEEGDCLNLAHTVTAVLLHRRWQLQEQEERQCLAK